MNEVFLQFSRFFNFELFFLFLLMLLSLLLGEGIVFEIFLFFLGKFCYSFV